MSGPVKGFYWWDLLSTVSYVPVGVILKDYDIILASQLCNPFSSFKVQGSTSWVLEGWNHVDHLWIMDPYLLFKILNIHAVIIHLHGHALGLEHVKYLHTVYKGWRLHKNHITWIDVKLAHKVHGLKTACQYHNIVRVGIHTLGTKQVDRKSVV